ncbi:DUF1206 domain-containing protein [Mycobacterium sp. SMC-4]|uniref:DUF1206 domain-containing protein n=1 Tax=Mycobacterium sp. SMC-4 TaxID=2857059 RepID=UPI003CFC6B49
MTTRPSAASLHRSAHGAADRATDSKAFEYTARAGFAASGVLHLLVGYIIGRLAFVGGGGNADQSGALATLGSQTGGAIMLWVVAIGLAALGLWRLAEAVIGSKPSEAGRDDNPAWKRGKSVALAVVNFAIAFSAARFAMGSGQSSTQQNTGMSAQLMQSGWGKALLLAVGAGVLAVGAYHVYKGVSEKFLDELQVSRSTAITVAGVVGYVAKGVVLGGAGVLVVVATLQADPTKASGLDAAVKTLGEAPFGKFLLIAAALGIAAFGVFNFIRSRYNRM